MISSLSNNNFKVYLVPAKFEKAYNEITTIPTSHNINIDTIFTTVNCSTKKRARQQKQVGATPTKVLRNNEKDSADDEVEFINSHANSIPSLTSGTPSSSGTSSPVSMEEDNEIPDDRVFTSEQIKDALRPPLFSPRKDKDVYKREKLKFNRDMTFKQIKNTELQDIDIEAFHSKLKNMTGGSQQTGGMWQRGGFFMVCS
jgi:hypothetical protein